MISLLNPFGRTTPPRQQDGGRPAQGHVLAPLADVPCGSRRWLGTRAARLVGGPFGAAGRAKWMRNAICTQLAGAVCGRRAWPRRLPGGLQMDERRGRARPFFSACNPAFSSQRRGLGHRKSRRAGIGGATTRCAGRNSPVGRAASPALGSPLCLWRGIGIYSAERRLCGGGGCGIQWG